ncbi:MAG: hypothetical protein ACK56I_23735, partial [bacterium]
AVGAAEQGDEPAGRRAGVEGRRRDPSVSLSLLETLRDQEVLGRAAIRLGDQFQRLDGRDVDVLLLAQGRERLGGDFLEVRE